MTDLTAVLARAFMRPWLSFGERKRRGALVAALTTIKEQALKSQESGFRDSATILNIALFFLIAERDFQCLKIDALTHPNEWKRKLCARVILLTIHEWDADKVFGSALRGAPDRVGASDDARKETVDALRTARSAQGKARKQFALLRNATIAHRDADALVQYQAIAELKIEDVFRIAAEFYVGVRRFINVLPKLIAESGTTTSLVRQWLESSREQL
jgi:hypothetical protein